MRTVPPEEPLIPGEWYRIEIGTPATFCVLDKQGRIRSDGARVYGPLHRRPPLWKRIWRRLFR